MESIIINQNFQEGEYLVDTYDLLCEEHFKITKIIPLKQTPLKIFFNIIIHILTVGLIQFVYGMYPKVEKLFRYESCSYLDMNLVH